MSSIIGRAIIVTPSPINADKILNNNTWEVIKKVSDRKQGQNYWAVGDCKEITMNGKVSDGLTLTNYTAWVFIIGFNHNAEREGNGISFQGFKATNNGTPVCLTDSGYSAGKTKGTWFNMNNSQSNSGGWQSCSMRSSVMPLIKSALPADLQAVIKTSTIYTAAGTGNIDCTATDDDVFLLAEYEVFGSTTYASTQEPNYLKQYSYYSAGNSKMEYKHNSTGSRAFWLLRSPNASYYNTFCAVNVNGGANANNTTVSAGVSPCFKV